VIIEANAPGPNEEFYHWEGDVDTVADIYSAQTTIIIEESVTKVTATYRSNDTHFTWGLAVYGFGDPSYMDWYKTYMDDLGVDRFRYEVSWLEAEVSPDVYHPYLDPVVEWAQANGYSIFWTFSTYAPDWECDPENRYTDAYERLNCVFAHLDRWSAFVKAFMTYYTTTMGLRIDEVQFANEVVQGSFWPDSWSLVDYVAINNAFYDAVKSVSPDTRVVLAGFDQGTIRRYAACAGADVPLDQYLGGGKWQPVPRSEYDTICTTDAWTVGVVDKVDYILTNAKYDAIDLHLYYDPEFWPAYYDVFKAKIGDRGITVTEFGGPDVISCNLEVGTCTVHETIPSPDGSGEFVYDDAPYSQDVQATRLVDYMTTLEFLDIDEAYYFKLVEDGISVNSCLRFSGLIQPDPWEEKPSYAVFREISLGAERR
jgi:hypothetical protein